MCYGPDSTYVVSVISQYIANPSKTYCKAMKWIRKYLKSSKDVGLIFARGENEVTDRVIGFYDSYYVGILIIGGS